MEGEKIGTTCGKCGRAVWTSDVNSEGLCCDCDGSSHAGPVDPHAGENERAGKIVLAAEQKHHATGQVPATDVPRGGVQG